MYIYQYLSLLLVHQMLFFFEASVFSDKTSSTYYEMEFSTNHFL